MLRWVIRLLAAIFLFCLLAPGGVPAQAQSSSVTLEQIDLGLSGQSLKQWYETVSSNTGDDTYFGAYVTLPVGSDLYIGLGSARPAEDTGDGSYFALFDGTNLSGIAETDEQGLHEMIYDSSLVHIAGTDPRPDDHSAGNHYTYSPGGTFTKYRDPLLGLTNVYHTWGLWKPGTTLYAAASAHDGSDPGDCAYGTTCFGQLFSSTDNGQTWTGLSVLGDYRAYDIIGFDGDLYAIHNDQLGGPLSASRSTDGGGSWNPVTGLTGNVGRTHMLEFDGRLILASFDRSVLYAIDDAENLTSHALPSGYLVGSTYSVAGYMDYKLLVVAKGYLYRVAENQSTSERAIIRTTDLGSWERMVSTPDRLISLSYWPDQGWLVTATPGAAAKLWRVDLSGTPTAVTVASVVQSPPVAALFPVAVIVTLLILVYISWKSSSLQQG